MDPCPIKYALYILNGKWKFHIIWELSKQESIRYNELKRQLKGISNMMLTKNLQELQNNHVVDRIQYNEVPSRVEYSLTQLGKELLPALGEMSQWGEKVRDYNQIPCSFFEDK